MQPKTFASLFNDPTAKELLAGLAGVQHTNLPTFSLTTTSLRHLTKWLDRLEDISAGKKKPHGNYFADPAGIGLVDTAKSPPVLTPSGISLLARKQDLYGHPGESEYELVKLLYFSGVKHPPAVQATLQAKRGHMLKTLQQFSPTPNLSLFISNPKLLVVAELVAQFPGAIARLVQLPTKDLIDLENLTEADMEAVGKAAGVPTGLDRLCKRIAGDFTRAQDRRLHYITSMALLTVASSTPANTAIELKVPYPFANLLSPVDLYKLHAQYTREVSIWFDGTKFLVSSTKHFSALASKATTPVSILAFKPQMTIPSGKGSTPAKSPKRDARRKANATPVTVIVDQMLAERAEDFVETAMMQLQFKGKYMRVGHRSGETLALPDGMVPGADFYVVNSSGEPIHFIEVKSIAGNPPCEVTLTRAEYWRARWCALNGLPYWLLLVDVTNGQWWKVADLAETIAKAQLEEVTQFTIRIG